jgi:predicted NBD/HSP70 family sugar kinase
MVAPGGAQKVDFHDLVGSLAAQELAREYGIHEPTAARAMAAAAARTDEPARGYVAAFAERVAIGLAAVIAVLDPPLVVIGGDIGQAGGPPLCTAVSAAMADAAPLETTIAATLLDDDAPLLGAVDAGLSAVREDILATLRQPA